MSLLRRILCCVLLLAAAPAYAQFRPLTYIDVSGLRVHQVSAEQVTLIADLRFYNPNGYGLSLKDADINAWINGHYLGRGITEARVHLPARDTFTVPVTITAKPGDIFTNALSLLTQEETEAAVRLEGSLKAGKAGIYIRVPVRYEGRQPVRF